MMKKTIYFGFVILTALLSVSASVWEGAASVSLNGELPENGYYAASRSFPRNTIVDITNLETGMSIRVIVASGLDSPGLLALLSKEAASAIGLPIRSVGRIRMTMPSDPVAFSLFPEEISSSGDPDFDPLAVIAAAGDSGFDVEGASEAIRRDSARTDDVFVSVPIETESDPAAVDIVDLPAPYTPSPERETEDLAKSDPAPLPFALYQYLPEPASPETAPPTSGIPPVEPALVPAGPRPPVSPFSEPPFLREIPSNEGPATDPASYMEPMEERISEPPSRTELVLEPVIPPIAERVPKPSTRAEPAQELFIRPLEERVSEPPARTELVLEPVIPPVPERVPEPPARTELVLEQVIPPVAERVLEPPARVEPLAESLIPPLEEQVSESPSRTELVLEPVIPPLAERVPEPPAPAEPAQELFIPPVEERVSEPPSRTELVLEPVIPPVVERVPEPPARVEPLAESLIPPLEEQDSAPLPSVPSVKEVFSVPVISSLEKGKYYLQLAAYTLPELVEDELARIDSFYPRAIQETGNPEKPLYRILIGPVNLGESGALLQRFKTSGYRDAFVRKEG